MVGIMMSYVGNSRPASGSEHHLSHFFEITGLLRNKDYYLHGIDVLYSAAVTAQLRERLCALKKPLPAITARLDGWRDDVKEIYSSAAEGVIALQERVGLYREIDRNATDAKWDEIVALLSEAVDVSYYILVSARSAYSFLKHVEAKLGEPVESLGVRRRGAPIEIKITRLKIEHKNIKSSRRRYLGIELTERARRRISRIRHKRLPFCLARRIDTLEGRSRHIHLTANANVKGLGQAHRDRKDSL
jgi:hypothetical protein